MALGKLKQVNEDKILVKAEKAEHGKVSFAHLNVLVDYINKLEKRIEELENPE